MALKQWLLSHVTQMSSCISLVLALVYVQLVAVSLQLYLDPLCIFHNVRLFLVQCLSAGSASEPRVYIVHQVATPLFVCTKVKNNVL